jgi:hypothetical protein
MGILQATSFTRVANLRPPAGKAQEPLTTELVRLETISKVELNTTAAPSRLGCRKTPKSNKQTRSKLEDQALLDVSLNAMHLNLIQSL